MKVILITFLTIICNSFAYKDIHYLKDRSVMVHLFEWKWNDIANECEKFLAPKGFGGVQVSPPSENLIINKRPWFERYQPISYKLVTRSGNEQQFAQMVARCNKVGVRIYADAVINHMTTGIGGIGTGGTIIKTNERVYSNVPYKPSDFHYPYCTISDYNKEDQIRNCELNGLHDLNQTKEYVREKIISYINHLIDLGVAGVRIDAAKHMSPVDLKIIYSKLNNLNTKHGFPANARPYIYQEVIDFGGEAVSRNEYVALAAVTEFRYGKEIGRVFRGYNKMKWLVNWGPDWSLLPTKDGIVFVDNHDNQRGHGGGSSDILTYKTSKQYKGAIAFTLAHPYGQPRIMSSFAFDNSDTGPPQDKNENILSPIINEDNTCGNGWICEHRWRQIYQMVQFRNIAKETSITQWWDNDKNQIAFCRGKNAFIAINNDNFDLDAELPICLPAGKYCDIISGTNLNNKCTGKMIVVKPNGLAQIKISPDEYDMHVAIHIGPESRLGL